MPCSRFGGCTGPREYVHNGFKVGPNYCPPGAQVANNWIDATDKRVRTESEDLNHWWRVFNDPVLDGLVYDAYHQNLTLREAGFRVLQARAQLAISVGSLFPQTQYASGSFSRNAASAETANNIFDFGIPGTHRFFSQWDFGFNLGWELDFWGRFRRAIESNQATLDASVADYDDVLVTLLGDVATNYVQLRTLEQQIDYARFNVELQRQTLTIVEARFKAGTTSELDVRQSRSTLAQTEAGIPELEISLRQAANRLCILMGIPPQDLQARLGTAPIPTAPVEVAIGIPADLLRRRPDVRRAERQAAAQSAQIGVAEVRFLSGHFHPRHDRLFRRGVPRPVPLDRFPGIDRPVVPMEDPELRQDFEQRAAAKSQVPGTGHRLRAVGPQRQRRKPKTASSHFYAPNPARACRP